MQRLNFWACAIAALMCFGAGELEAQLRSASTGAVRWVTVYEDDTRVISADATRLEPQGGAKYSAWLKWDAVGSTGPGRPSRTIEKVEYDCGNFRRRTVTSTDYTTSGKVLRTEDGRYSQWEDIVPDSIGEELAQAICDAAAYARL